MDFLNARLTSLDKQEDLLLEQLNQVKNRKRSLYEKDQNSTGQNATNKTCKKDEVVNGKVVINGQDNYIASFNCSLEQKTVFSPVAMVKLKAEGSTFGPVRALLDTGAQPNLVSTEIGRQFKSACLPTSNKLIGINGQPFTIRRRINLEISPWYETQDEVYIKDSFWLLPNDSEWKPIMPARPLNPTIGYNSTQLRLADPEFYMPNRVQLLLGAGFFAKIITSVVQRNIDGTILLATSLGIVIFGSSSGDIFEQTVHTIEYKAENQLDKLLERLWQQDEVGASSPYTEEEIQAENHFVKTHSRNNSGRFIVQIPLKSTEYFGNSRDIALRRFFYGEKKRAKNVELNQIYIEKMREMIRIGHLVQATEQPRDGELVYYIPHHAIDKNNRIVYDASCKTDKGISLNDIQLVGPKLQKDLPETIMRFRRHRYAVYADIKKMYNQVQLARNQWNLQRIFWREDENSPLREYWMTVVTFGLSASPFMAVRSVMQCAKEAKSKFPVAAKAIEEDFYMDDAVTGADTENNAIKLADQMYAILESAGFELCQWKSNSEALVKHMNSEMESTTMLSEVEGTTVLGLKWLIDSDKFTFVVKSPKLDQKITKRKIASAVAQIYDPNGYVSPVTIVGKLLVQDLWRIKTDWDEKVPIELERKFRELWDGIKYLEKFTIDRWINTGTGAAIQIHGFSDSSELALGAAIFVRAAYPNGLVTCNLLVSKSKVAPLKMITIPRLELSAAELLSRLVKNVMNSMEWDSAEYYLWIDSSPAYFWIRKIPRDLKTYVANRVSSIQTNTDIRRWKHINGKENPADLLTRGISPKDLVNNNLWLHGPDWITLPQSEWPKSTVMQQETKDFDQELKVFTLTEFKDPLCIGMHGSADRISLLEYVSKLEKAINIISYVSRFIKIRVIEKKGKPKRRTRRNETIAQTFAPTLEEKAAAMEYLIRKSQQEYYNKELTAIKAGLGIPDKSKIGGLKPILDNNGILRVGGRLDRSDLDYEAKHPAIIPNGSKLAWLLIDYAHRQTKHGGSQVMMQHIRQLYWIPKLRSGLRSFVHKCVVCVRLNARLENQLMAELPGERVQVGKPFLHTGVDYAGPFELRMISRKGENVRRKCWIAIFVCFKTRAVHIDVVTELSAVAFIACFERFVARRGRCEKMFSDNGTCFVGTEKELRRALEHWTEKETLEHLSNRGTEWHFMSPAAPHQGGIYEAAVKSMKFHLKRIVGQKTFVYEQFVTLLHQIEAILNSRPIHPLSDDPSDLQALTPGHFLIGEPLILPLPFKIDHRPESVGIKLWKERQRMVEHFWKRWQEEYLATLQERKKWRKEKENIKLGQLVIIKNERFPPAQWALGRICRLLPSKDGIVRTVIVRTANNQLTRPVQKLCIVPIETDKLA